MRFVSKFIQHNADKPESKYYCPHFNKLALFITTVAYCHGFCEIPKNEIAEAKVDKGYLCFPKCKKKPCIIFYRIQG